MSSQIHRGREGNRRVKLVVDLIKNKSISDEIRVEVPSVICPVIFLNSRSVHHREVSHYEDAKPWNEMCDLAFYCTTRNEIEKSDVVSLVTGSTMACTSQAVDHRSDSGFKLGSTEHTSEAIVKKYGAVRLTFEVEGLNVLRTTQQKKKTFDGPSCKDWRGGRDASFSIIPSSTAQLREKLVCIIWMRFCERKLHRQMPQRGRRYTRSIRNIQFCELPFIACVKIVGLQLMPTLDKHLNILSHQYVGMLVKDVYLDTFLKLCFSPAL
ncbi:hypothetical protein C5167_003669 [Papaver somniferum]|uniref:Uncharacterized protein n=1 Tax=Papaver somniferum TaxID=3469 RepID=A0A4Y7L4L7_PAPSO|nr:hypothetical protein C5167_003669 [Papaver somniferum]